MSDDREIEAIVDIDISAAGTTRCPLCGREDVHRHNPVEIVCYRNGIKRGLGLTVAKWNFYREDAFNALDVQMTDAIEAGMTVGEAKEIAECILAFRDLRERFERAVPPPEETTE